MINYIDEDLLLNLLKQRLSITFAKKDEYLRSIIQAVVSELVDQAGVRKLTTDIPYMRNTIINYAGYKYESSELPNQAMPQYLRTELNNLYTSGGGENKSK
jgi:hypothetical protein